VIVVQELMFQIPSLVLELPFSQEKGFRLLSGLLENMATQDQVCTSNSSQKNSQDSSF
jgi:hypothetical protein